MQKAMAAEFNGADDGFVDACMASDMRAAVIPVVVVGIKGPSNSRGSVAAPRCRARHLPFSMCRSRGREVRLAPPSKRAPHARGQGRMPRASREGSLLEEDAS